MPRFFKPYESKDSRFENTSSGYRTANILFTPSFNLSIIQERITGFMKGIRSILCKYPLVNPVTQVFAFLCVSYFLYNEQMPRYCSALSLNIPFR